jgi:hypothetical protein
MTTANERCSGSGETPNTAHQLKTTTTRVGRRAQQEKGSCETVCAAHAIAINAWSR